MTDWAQVRDLFSLDPHVRHLNHGSFGAVPRPVAEFQDRIRGEVESNPSHFYWAKFYDRLEESRLATAAFLGANPQGFVFVPNATTGAATVLASLALAPGDDVLITDHAYGAIKMIAERACIRMGASLVVAHVPLPSEPKQALESILGQLSERTRIAIVDHVASPTAIVFPISEIVESLKARGVITLVDAAHAPGMLDVDLESIAPDFWVGNFHKWLCAPRGAAGLYVAERWRERLEPLVESWQHGPGLPGRFSWSGTDDYSAYLSVPAAIQFFDDFGWDRVRSHNRDLARLGAENVARALGNEGAPTGIPAGMFESMTLVGLPEGFSDDEDFSLTKKVLRELQCQIAITSWKQRSYIRLSAHVYNSPADYEALASGLPVLLKEWDQAAKTNLP